MDFMCHMCRPYESDILRPKSVWGQIWWREWNVMVVNVWFSEHTFHLQLYNLLRFFFVCLFFFNQSPLGERVEKESNYHIALKKKKRHWWLATSYGLVPGAHFLNKIRKRTERRDEITAAEEVERMPLQSARRCIFFFALGVALYSISAFFSST